MCRLQVLAVEQLAEFPRCSLLELNVVNIANLNLTRFLRWGCS